MVLVLLHLREELELARGAEELVLLDCEELEVSVGEVVKVSVGVVSRCQPGCCILAHLRNH